jgi:hypothetical protein
MTAKGDGFRRARFRIDPTARAVFAAYFGLFIAPSLLSALTSDSNKWIVLAGATAVALPVSASFSSHVRSRFRSLRRRSQLVETAARAPKGVVVATFAGVQAAEMSGTRPALLRVLMERSSPHRLVLLGTEKSAGDVPAVRERMATWRLERIPEVEVVVIPAGEFANEAVTETLQRLIDQGIDPSDIVVDGTGATAIMSVSAFAGAMACGVDFQAVRQDHLAVSLLLAN